MCLICIGCEEHRVSKKCYNATYWDDVLGNRSSQEWENSFSHFIFVWNSCTKKCTKVARRWKFNPTHFYEWIVADSSSTSIPVINSNYLEDDDQTILKRHKKLFGKNYPKFAYPKIVKWWELFSYQHCSWFVVRWFYEYI